MDGSLRPKSFVQFMLTKLRFRRETFANEKFALVTIVPHLKNFKTSALYYFQKHIYGLDLSHCNIFKHGRYLGKQLITNKTTRKRCKKILEFLLCPTSSRVGLSKIHCRIFDNSPSFALSELLISLGEGNIACFLTPSLIGTIWRSSF